MHNHTLSAEVVLPGFAAGPLLYADLGLSFMGGVDAARGVVIDGHHPLCGKDLTGAILAIPSGRGSCAGSLVMFELLLNGHAPKALIFQHKETILTLGVLIAQALFGRGIPVLCVPDAAFAALSEARHARIEGGHLSLSDTPFPTMGSRLELPPLDLAGMEISQTDTRFLAGADGEAARVALEIILRTAQLEGATRLVDVDMAHIDGCFYQGPGGLAFVERLLDLGAKVRVPATMNALCVDRKEWRAQGVSESLGLASDALAEAYLQMGVRASYTCAPYLLPDPPKYGQQIAWGESNAVVFANSVLGAKTLKYPDYLDILVAITGRAPLADCHVDEKRRATLRIDLPKPSDADDAYFATLGYLVGKLSPNDIPLITGLEGVQISHDALKTFGAAFATTSAAAMFHILGITPEAATLEQAGNPLRRVTVSMDDLRDTWRELNTATSPGVDLVSLGNPHFSATEIASLAHLCRARRKAAGVALVVTCGREVFAQAEAAGDVATIKAFGGIFLNDTCWCLIAEPIVSAKMHQIATNSGKYAHYGPAAVGKAFHLASLERCVDAACSGEIDVTEPAWLG